MKARVFVSDRSGVVRAGTLTLAPADIEEAVLRCGWTLLNADNLSDVTAEDRAAIECLEARGVASGWKDYGASWWAHRFAWEPATA